MRFHENYQAVQAPVCELHEQRRLASLGTHHQGSSPALTPTLRSLRRKTEARGRKSHTEWPKNTKCEKATVNFHDQSIERESKLEWHMDWYVTIGKSYAEQLHPQALLDLDNFEGEATDVLHMNSNRWNVLKVVGPVLKHSHLLQEIEQYVDVELRSIAELSFEG